MGLVEDLNDSQDPKHTLFCRENAFVAIYALFSDNKCPLFTRLGGVSRKGTMSLFLPFFLYRGSPYLLTYLRTWVCARDTCVSKNASKLNLIVCRPSRGSRDMLVVSIHWPGNPAAILLLQLIWVPRFALVWIWNQFNSKGRPLVYVYSVTKAFWTMFKKTDDLVLGVVSKDHSVSDSHHDHF